MPKLDSVVASLAGLTKDGLIIHMRSVLPLSLKACLPCSKRLSAPNDAAEGCKAPCFGEKACQAVYAVLTDYVDASLTPAVTINRSSYTMAHRARHGA